MPRTIDLPNNFTATSLTSLIVTQNQATGRITYPNFLYWLGIELGLTQELTASSDVNFNSVQTVNTGTFDRINLERNIAIGGPDPLSVLDTSLYISNSRVSNRPTNIKLRGYTGNYGSFTPAYPQIKSEVAKGLLSNAEAVDTGNILGEIAFSGHDGIRFTNTITGLISFRAAETWIGTGDSTTKSGTSWRVASQPINTVLKDSTQFNHLWQEWTLSGDNVAINNLYIGDGSMNTATILVRSNGVVQQGHGSTNVNFVNSQLRLIGVPAEATLEADNQSLDDTLKIQFVAGRGSGTQGRRNPVKQGDTLGLIDYRGQYLTSSTDFGVAVGSISLKAISDFTVANRGTKFVLNTVNSGTTSESTRLDLSSKFHRYSSDNHVFLSSTGSVLATLTTETGLTIYTTTTFAGGLLETTLATRTVKTGSVTTGSLNTATMEIVGFKSYVLSKVATDYPARVRIYTDTTERNTDFYRSTTTSVPANLGLIAEVITTSGSLTKLVSPGVFGFNNDSPSSSTIYVSVTNNDTVTRNITLNLTLLQLEQTA